MEYVEDASSALVLAAMSGGVDSSVMAYLLRCAGFDVRGITMSLIAHAHAQAGQEDDAVRAARHVCEELGIAHEEANLSELFQEKVIDAFCDAYIDGSTPNPCVECNRYLKFGELHQIRKREGAQYLATGHYVRRRFNEETGKWQLLRGKDPDKDQSYFLFHLSQEAIAHTLFPLGEMSKQQVRSVAHECGLSAARSPESQDICFIPDGDHVSFIEGHLGRRAAFDEGPIIDMHGKVLGVHHGLVRYTIGQRKGIGVAAREPLYVVGKSMRDNELVVATREDALVRRMRVRLDEHCESDISKLPAQIQVKSHYRQALRSATIESIRSGCADVILDEPQMPTAAGQSAVFYDGDVVLGGGVVVSTGS